MLLKLLLVYCLAVIIVIGFGSVKSVSSINQLIFPLLLTPLVYHLGLELVRRPRTRPVNPSKFLTAVQSSGNGKTPPPLDGKVVAGPAGISDRDKRLFLKLVGSTGLSLFFMSLVSKEARATFFGSMPGPGTIALKDSTGTLIDPALKQPTDGYNISQLDDTSDPDYAYYGFVNKEGNWYIQREALT